jgi:hypothetical protein
MEVIEDWLQLISFALMITGLALWIRNTTYTSKPPDERVLRRRRLQSYVFRAWIGCLVVASIIHFWTRGFHLTMG